MQHDVVARRLDGKGLVEIGRRRRIESYVLDRRAIGVQGTRAAGGGRLGSGEDVGRELPGDVGLGADRGETGGDRPVDGGSRRGVTGPGAHLHHGTSLADRPRLDRRPRDTGHR